MLLDMADLDMEARARGGIDVSFTNIAKLDAAWRSHAHYSGKRLDLGQFPASSGVLRARCPGPTLPKTNPRARPLSEPRP